MDLKKLIESLNDCVNHGDFASFSKKVDMLLNEVSDERATELLAAFLFNSYTSFKADGLALLMEIILRKNLNLGFVKFPDNNLFRAAVLHGSVDLFDCYIEEFCQPYLKKNRKVDANAFYIDLLTVAELYTDKISEKEQPVIKGFHFNGAFTKTEEFPNAVLINSEDYEVMNATVENYNAIIGRRTILLRLNQILENL